MINLIFGVSTNSFGCCLLSVSKRFPPCCLFLVISSVCKLLIVFCLLFVVYNFKLNFVLTQNRNATSGHSAHPMCKVDQSCLL